MPVVVILTYILGFLTLISVWRNTDNKGTRMLWTVAIALLPLPGMLAYFITKSRRKSK
ncbi:PLD nuclease N-terminal domain-containing protein [Leeuwenhoekiella sp. A16]|uniref:PLD nuclease N-terminal domain-containing protein n=1 Tax=unclassified Leeuwenhoekiella TaxID=2615029 RepID=UPI003A7FD509